MIPAKCIWYHCCNWSQPSWQRVYVYMSQNIGPILNSVKRAEVWKRMAKCMQSFKCATLLHFIRSIVTWLSFTEKLGYKTSFLDAVVRAWASAFQLWDNGFHSFITFIWKESVMYERSIKSRGFSPSTSDFPTWNVDKVGWERIQTNPNPSTVAMLRGQKLPRVSQFDLFESVWTASFMIQLSFQLKVRMIRTPPVTYWLTINTEKSPISNINIYL